MEDKALLIKALGSMYLSRAFEQETEQLVKTGKIHGTTHLATGQEACQVGLCLALSQEDWIISTHRCHGYTIAKGSDPQKMFSELLGYKAGLCKGLGGSMHFTDVKLHNAGSSAIVASGIPLATGIAFGLKKSNNNQTISTAIFGDGASSRGSIHECLNMASIWDLPILFYLENNLYGMSESIKETVATNSIASRCQGYNIKYTTVDGNDFLAVFAAVKMAKAYMLKNKRPYFIELLTYRQKGHSKNDKCLYRSKTEEAEWLKKDPIKRLEKYIIEKNFSTEAELQILKKQKFAEIITAELAAQSDSQVLTQEEADRYTFSPSPKTEELTFTGKETLSYREAIRAALEDEFKENSKTFLIGEDIGFYGGCFHVTEGLYKQFSKQLIETPVSEESFTGIALGSTLIGYHPIVEIMYADFFTLISDQIINHASQSYFMSGGQIPSPLVIRLPEGSGTGHGPQHTQSPEAAFANTPGLIIVAPSNSNDAYYLLRESIKNNNPVLFFEHKLLYPEVSKIQKSSKSLLFKANIVEEGQDLTIISYSQAVLTCQSATKELKEKYNINATLVDLRTISPLDKKTILFSAKKTGRVLIVQNPPLFTSISSEVASIIAEDKDTFSLLKAPIKRLGGKPTPVPFSENLEKNYIPTVALIIKESLSLVK